MEKALELYVATHAKAERLVNRLFQPREGQGLFEYAMILLFISIVVVGVAAAFTAPIETSFNYVAGVLNGAYTP